MSCRNVIIQVFQAYLIKLFEFHHLMEDIIQDMLSISTISWQLARNTKDVTTLSDIIFKVIFCTYIKKALTQLDCIPQKPSI